MNTAEMIRVFGRIGCLSFGGPAAQIALMQKELVEDRPLLSQQDFLKALSFQSALSHRDWGGGGLRRDHLQGSHQPENGPAVAAIRDANRGRSSALVPAPSRRLGVRRVFPARGGLVLFQIGGGDIWRGLRGACLHDTGRRDRLWLAEHGADDRRLGIGRNHARTAYLGDRIHRHSGWHCPRRRAARAVGWAYDALGDVCALLYLDICRRADD